MKIILVVPTFPKLSETFIVSKFLGLLDRGWDVHVVCQRSPVTAWHHFPALQQRADVQRRVHTTWPHQKRWMVAALWFPALLTTFWRNPKGTIAYFKRGWEQFGRAVFKRFYLDAVLLAQRPFLVHFEFGSLAAKRMSLKKLLNCAVTVSFRGYDLNFVGLDMPDYYADVWREATAVHLLGQDLWERAQKRGAPDTLPHTLIPPAIDVEKFRDFSANVSEEIGQQRPFRILSVGRLAWKKGYEFALQAVHLLEQQNIPVEYRIVGAGDYLESLTFARHQFNLTNNVQFLGAISPDGVREQMAWADVLLHTAVSEGFGNVVLEAQAMQLPVVCTDADGLPANIADGITGFVVPRRNPQAMAEKLAQLAHDKPLRARFGQAGRVRIQNYFKIEDQADAFSQFYRQALSTVPSKVDSLSDYRMGVGSKE